MNELLTLLPLAGIGAGAALVSAGAKTHRWQLPRIVRGNAGDGEVVLVDLGFLAAPLLGGLVAWCFATSSRDALLYGTLAGVAGPALLNSLVEPLLHKLGLPALPASNTGDGNGDKGD